MVIPPNTDAVLVLSGAEAGALVEQNGAKYTTATGPEGIKVKIGSGKYIFNYSLPDVAG